MTNKVIREYSGASLIEKRLAAGLTINKLAASARISAMTLRNWERGLTKPQLKKARAVRDVLAKMPKRQQQEPIDYDALPLDTLIDRQALENYMPKLHARMQKLYEDVKHMHHELSLMYHRINPNRSESNK